MLSVAPATPVYLYTQPADMRKSFDGLSGLVASAAGDDGELLDGGLFVFHNKRRDRLKILYFDQDGLALWYKRLEKGTFAFPAAQDDQNRLAVSPADLRLILDGVELSSVKRRPRYATPAALHGVPPGAKLGGADDRSADPRSRRPEPAQAVGGRPA